MDSVLYPARKTKTRNRHASPALKKPDVVLRVEDAAYLQGYELVLTFNDGSIHRVDFEPFLSSSDHPAIREYLDIEKFKQFRLTNGDVQWGDFDLCFPIIDLYNNDLLHVNARKKKNAKRSGVVKTGAHKSSKRRATKTKGAKASGA